MRDLVDQMGGGRGAMPRGDDDDAVESGAFRRSDACAALRRDGVTLIFDPKIFNYVIMALYVANAGRWAFHGGWADVSYWFSAFAITATVTWGYSR